MAAAEIVSGIPQLHFSGSRDSVIPPAVADNFSKASANDRCIQIRTVPEATHHDGWTQKWRELVRLPVSCGE